MTAMIDDSRSAARRKGSRPARSVGEGATGAIREILAAPRLAQADRSAVPMLAPLLDGPGGDRVRALVAFLLEAIARETLGDPDAAEHARRPRADDAALTHGETRVLHYLPTNLSAREIAGELYLSVNTIKTHQRHLYQKLGVRSRSQAVERARALGLLAPSSRRP
jgi:LuxR family transcriptional regulator, maltose regulon positive regulatory protein